MGDTVIKLWKSGETFIFNRAWTSVHNLLFGNIFVWHEGDMSVKHQDSSACATAWLKSIGYNGKKDFVFTGEVIDKDN